MGFNSGLKGLIVSIRHLVYVTLHRWPFGVQVGAHGGAVV